MARNLREPLIGSRICEAVRSRRFRPIVPRLRWTTCSRQPRITVSAGSAAKATRYRWQKADIAQPPNGKNRRSSCGSTGYFREVSLAWTFWVVCCQLSRASLRPNKGAADLSRPQSSHRSRYSRRPNSARWSANILHIYQSTGVQVNKVAVSQRLLKQNLNSIQAVRTATLYEGEVGHNFDFDAFLRLV